MRPAWPWRRHDNLAVWGRVHRSERQIEKADGDKKITTFEDAFLRSPVPGPQYAPLGITVDRTGVHFDGSRPSDLEQLLQTSVPDPEQLQRAAEAIAFLRQFGLSKYSPVPRGDGELPTPGYILIVDQVPGDASIRYGQADAKTFSDMLDAARAEHPDTPILIRSHPAALTRGKGHFRPEQLDTRTRFCDVGTNPWDILEGAKQVYCVSSQLGFDAILAGHVPVVFGQPFYAGWGLSDDRNPPDRRNRRHSAESLFAIAMLDYPLWFNHAANRACTFEEAAEQLLEEVRHYWLGRFPIQAANIRAWKRPYLQKFLGGGNHSVRFSHRVPSETNVKTLTWASALSESDDFDLRVEDGFLRSRGLGAKLTPPLSLVFDDIGIYYDPNHPSRLEQLIKESVHLPPAQLARAARLRAGILEAGVSKYNLTAKSDELDLPSDRQVILVPGQVEDDASIRHATTKIHTNAGLLQAARHANPDAFIIYKPHPDVVAGLRDSAAVPQVYDLALPDANIAMLLDRVDEVWTMTSLTGFEALLRGKPVTCLGTPFYAGWGLTRDLGPRSPRRDVTVSLDGLVHAALIGYPYYWDPISKRPMTAELAVERLAAASVPRPPRLAMLSGVQSRLSRFRFIWR